MAIGGNDITLKVGLQVDQSQGLQQVQQALAPMTRNIQNFNKNPILAKNFTQPLGRITGAADEFTKSLEASNARVLAFGASAGAIFAVQKAMTELVKTTITVEQKLTDISALLNVTDKEFKRFSDGLFQVARNTGLAFGEVADSANEFARQGKGVTETLKLTNSALALSKLGMMDSVNATESLTAALNTFRGEVNDSAVVVNKLAQVDAEFAVSSKDLAEAIKRTGSSAKDASVSFEELLAVVTVTQERTARGGAVIGNAFKTIFTRIQRPEVLNQLELIGVQVRKQNGEILPAIEILKQYASVYDSLNPALKSNTAQLIAGGRQINILKSLLPELAVGTGKFDAALKVANETTTEATDRLKILTSTTQGTLNAVTANLTKTAAEIGTLSVKPAIDNILGALDGLADLIGPDNFFGLGETIGKGVYEGIGRILSGPGLLLLGTVLAKLGGNLLKFVTTSGKSFLGLNKAADKQAQQQTIITNLLARQPEIVDKVLSGQLSIADAAAGFNKELTFAEAHYNKLNNLASTLAAKQKTFSGPSKRQGNAAGLIPNFVPNFAMADVQAEREAASAGGYRAGQIRRMNMPGVGGVTYNGKEKVKKFPGMEQPAIMPPALSKAGKNYRDQFKSVIGFDPYNSAFGFVPNFNLGQISDGVLQGAIRTGYFTAEEKKIIGNQTMTDLANTYKASNVKNNASLAPFRNKLLGLGGKAEAAREAEKLTAQMKKEATEGGEIDIAGRIGLLSMFGANNPSATTSTTLGQLSAFSEVIDAARLTDPTGKNADILSNAKITFKNVQVRSLEQASKDLGSEKNEVYEKFRASLNQNLTPVLSQIGAESIAPILGNQAPKIAEIQNKLKTSGGSLLPPGAEGDIFEQVIRLATKSPSAFVKSLGDDFRAPFDFEEDGQAGYQFRKQFFGKKGFDMKALVKADAKRTADPKSIRSLIKKAYNQAILAEKSDERKLIREFNLPYAGSTVSAVDPKTGQTAGPFKQTRMAKAGGHIPNFSLKAISDAIKREDRSGVRRDKIRVGYDRRLAASGGLGVYNTDEGSLGNAINMHMAAGRNKFQIQRQGKANGHVPNLAIVPPDHGTGPLTTIGSEVGPATLNAFDDLTVALNKVGSTFQGASKTSPTFGGPSLGQSSSPVLESVRKAEAKVIEEKIDKTKQENEKILKNSQAKDDNTSRSIANSFAITLAGDQIGQFGAKLSESDNVITSVIGSFAQFGGIITSYVPSVETALSVIGIEGNGIGEQLSNLKGKFVGLIATSGGLAAAMQKATASALFGGGSRFATRGALGGGKLGILGSARLTGRAFKQGGLDRVAKVTGGRGVVGGLAGLGAKGLAATGVGALAVGGLFAANKVLAKRREDTFKKLQENIKQTTDKFASMSKGLESLGKSVKDFGDAAKIGDKAAQDAARTQIRSDVAKVDFDQFFADRGPVTLGSGRKVSSASDVFGLLTDQTASMDDKSQIQNLTSNYVNDLTRLNKNTSALASVLQEQAKGQNPLWVSTQAAQESINAANLAFGDIISQISGDRLVKVGAALEDLDESFEKLGRGSDQLTEKSLKSVSDKMQNLVTLLTKEGFSRDQIINALNSLQNAKGLDEEGTLRLYDETTKGLLPRVKERIEAEKDLIDSDKDLLEAQRKQKNEVETVRKQSRVLAERLDALKVALDTAGKISEITRKSEAEREKIIRDTSLKINKLLVSDYTQAVQSSEAQLIERAKKFKNDRIKLEEDADQAILDATRKFADERLKAFEGSQGATASNPALQTQFNTLVNTVISRLSGGADADDVVREIEKLRQLPIFNPRFGPEAAATTKIFDNFIREVKDAGSKNEEALKVLRKQLEEDNITNQKQLEAQLKLLQVQQAIRFGGGGALNPFKTLQDFGQAQTNIARGRFTGNRDLETQGLLNVVNAFKDLQISQGTGGAGGTLGNITGAVTDRLQEQIAENLRTLIGGVGFRESDFSGVRVEGVQGQGIEAIARARALSITRPDESKLLQATKVGSQEIVNAITKLDEKFVSVGPDGIKVSESNQTLLNALNAAGQGTPKSPVNVVDTDPVDVLTKKYRDLGTQIATNQEQQQKNQDDIAKRQNQIAVASQQNLQINNRMVLAEKKLADARKAVEDFQGPRQQPGYNRFGQMTGMIPTVDFQRTLDEVTLAKDEIKALEDARDANSTEIKNNTIAIKNLKESNEILAKQLGKSTDTSGRGANATLFGQQAQAKRDRDQARRDRDKAEEERKQAIEQFKKAVEDFKTGVGKVAEETMNAFSSGGFVRQINEVLGLNQRRVIGDADEANQNAIIQAMVRNASRESGISNRFQGRSFVTRGIARAIEFLGGDSRDRTSIRQQRADIGLGQLDQVIKDSTSVIKLYSSTVQEQINLEGQLEEQSNRLLTSYKKGEIGFTGLLEGIASFNRFIERFKLRGATGEDRAAAAETSIQRQLRTARGRSITNDTTFQKDLNDFRTGTIDALRNRGANRGGGAASEFEFAKQVADGVNGIANKFEEAGLRGSDYQQKVDEIARFWETLTEEGGSVDERIKKFNSFRLRQQSEADDLAFDNNKINLTQRQAEANKRLQETFDASIYSSEQFSEALGEAIGSRFIYNATTFREQSSGLILGVVDDFKSGIKGALGEAIRGTATLREAFSSMFDKITDRILDNSLNMGVDALFGAVGKGLGGDSFFSNLFKSKGGLIKGYNAGGFVNQGSGVRDDVPAMMQGGEYVIRKSSVNKYGRGLFDALNSGGRVGYQRGDRVMQNRLRPEFVYNDPKRPTGGSYINTQGLSAFALMESGSPMIAIQREREKTLENYIKDKKAYDEMVRKAQEQFKKQQKARMKSTLISVGLQAATFGISQMMPTGGAGGSAQGAGGRLQGVKGLEGLDVQNFNLPDINPNALRLGSKGGLMTNSGFVRGFARGGRNRDNIPALLMGGEYVVNKQSVDKYGVGLFNDLNSGRARGFANGGMVGGDGGGVGGAPTTANNNFEINITMNNNGEGETTTTSNQNENQSQEQQERNEQLGLAVKNAVQTELIEQQRPGGLLYREDRI